MHVDPKLYIKCPQASYYIEGFKNQKNGHWKLWAQN